MDRRRRYASGGATIATLTCCCCILAKESLAFAPPSVHNLPHNFHTKKRISAPRAIKGDSDDDDGIVVNLPRNKVSLWLAFPPRIRIPIPRADDAPIATTDSIPSSSLSPQERRERFDNLRRLRRDVLARRRRAVTDRENEESGRQDIQYEVIAIVPCLLAFAFWGDISLALSNFIDAKSVMGVVSEDTRLQFTNSILRPTVTGVLVPVISIALATLVSTTVNVLRERQVHLRALVNKEACDLRLLRRAIFGVLLLFVCSEKRCHFHLSTDPKLLFSVYRYVWHSTSEFHLYS